MNNDRVNDSIGYHLPETVLKDSLKLLASLNNSLDHSSQEAKAIIDAILSNGTLAIDNEEDNGPGATGHVAATSTADTDSDIDVRKILANSEIASSSDRKEDIEL